MKTLVTAILITLMATPLYAATKGRIMTNGIVSMYKNGKIIRSFKEEGPIDENALIACKGTCLIKLKGVSLVAVDRTRFAVQDSDGILHLYLESGQINFAIADINRQFAFYTSNGYFVKSEGFIAPAAYDNAVKGYIRTTDRHTEIGMDKGAMIAQTDQGTQTIDSGQAILLAIAEVPRAKEDDDDDKAAWAPCPFFSWECKTAAQKISIVGTGGMAALGVGLLVYHDQVDSDDKVVNISLPLEEESASPNQ